MLFKDKDVICFLGDSITANDTYVSEIYQVLRSQARVRCINCGVSGGSADKAVNYLYEKCLNYNPDYVVTMFGINDIMHWLHSKANYNDAARAIIADAIEFYKRCYDDIVSDCIDYGAEVILCVPPPYDDVSDVSGELMPCREDLNTVSDYVFTLAKKYRCRVIDYREVMVPLLNEGIYNPDRIHPNARGQHIIAQTFLYETDAIKMPDYNSAFVPEDWITFRHIATEPLHKLNYVEYCDIYKLALENNWDLTQKKQEVKRRLDNLAVKSGFIYEAYSFYLSEIDFLNIYEARVLRRSK